MSRPRAWLSATLLIVLGTVVGVGLVELGLRAAGRRPWRAREDSRSPPVLARDPVLGWRPQPGEWWFGPYGTEQRWVSAHILPDGSRATGPAPAGGRPELLLLGCSFTMGWAVNDDETWAWGLQSLRPQVHVENRGVIGYGTYHSLLLLEERLRAGDRPAAVLYGYFFGHDERNAVGPHNLFGIAMYSLEGMARTPYSTLEPSGDLVRHPPESWPAWPLHDRLALVGVLERAYAQLHAGEREQHAFDLTNRLVVELAETCRRYHIPFAMVVLLAPAAKIHAARLEFMRAHDVPVIDCDAASAPELKDGLHMVPQDGHPDAATHAYWARCVSAGMDRLRLLDRTGATS